MGVPPGIYPIFSSWFSPEIPLGIRLGLHSVISFETRLKIPPDMCPKTPPGFFLECFRSSSRNSIEVTEVAPGIPPGIPLGAWESNSGCFQGFPSEFLLGIIKRFHPPPRSSEDSMSFSGIPRETSKCLSWFLHGFHQRFLRHSTKDSLQFLSFLKGVSQDSFWDYFRESSFLDYPLGITRGIHLTRQIVLNSTYTQLAT